MNSSQDDEVLARDATLRQLLDVLAPFLALPGVTEVCVNSPGAVFTESATGWQRHELPELTASRCERLAGAIASFSDQSISEQQPILSAILPAGERVQIVLPPAIDARGGSLSIRKPGHDIRPLRAYEEEGAFEHFAWGASRKLQDRFESLSTLDRRLVEHLKARRLGEFLRLAVRERKNIAVVGETGSGKTTLMKTLCQSIPKNERLLTIEDVRELMLPLHPNCVHLLYSKGSVGVARITPADLIASAMRMKPDRVLLAELRGSEAFDYLKLLTTGHAGSITSFHAESGALAAERYVFMAKEHPQASIYDPDTLKHLVRLTIDIVLHVHARVLYDEQDEPIRKERFVSEVIFDPVAKLEALFGDAEVHR